MNLHVVNHRIADSIGDLCALYLCDFLGHRLLIQLCILIRNKVDRCRDALRHRLGRDDNELFALGNLSRLSGCQNDVLVVRQNEYGIRIHLLHRIQNVRSARIHGLSAGNNIVNAQSAEDLRKALACADGDHADLLVRLLRLRLHALLRGLRRGCICCSGFLLRSVLLFQRLKALAGAEVRDGDLLQLSVQKRLLQDQTRIIGMELHRHRLLIAVCHDQLCDGVHIVGNIAVDLVIVGLGEDLVERNHIAVPDVLPGRCRLLFLALCPLAGMEKRLLVVVLALEALECTL